MTGQTEKPPGLPYRKVGDQDWEVLFTAENAWLPCESLEDARLIAAAPALHYDSMVGSRAGNAFADELERTADALDKYNIKSGARIFRRRATEVRAAATQ